MLAARVFEKAAGVAQIRIVNLSDVVRNAAERQSTAFLRR